MIHVFYPNEVLIHDGKQVPCIPGTLYGLQYVKHSIVPAGYEEYIIFQDLQWFCSITVQVEQIEFGVGCKLAIVLPYSAEVGTGRLVEYAVIPDAAVGEDKDLVYDQVGIPCAGGIEAFMAASAIELSMVECPLIDRIEG